MPERLPSLSVIMPVFNAGRYLRQSIDSILMQSYRDYELIVVNDGSTDESPVILKEFEQCDDRVRLISRPNTGLVGALNDGLSLATGEYVARMDADDVSVTHRFQKQLDYLKNNPHVVGVSGAMRYIDDEGLPIYDFAPPTESCRIANDLRNGRGEAFLHGAAMFRREVLLHVGGYRVECKHVEDVDLFLRLLEVGELSNLLEVLLFYRMHEQSVCHLHQEEQQERLQTLLGSTWERRKKHIRYISFRENLAYTALRAGNMKTARVNAMKDLRSRPFSRSLLIYIAALVGFGRQRSSSIATTHQRS